MNHLRALLLTSWFLPLVLADTLLVFGFGLYVGHKIGFAHGQQTVSQGQ